MVRGHASGGFDCAPEGRASHGGSAAEVLTIPSVHLGRGATVSAIAAANAFAGRNARAGTRREESVTGRLVE